MSTSETVGDDTDVDPAEPASITLQQLYKSTQDQLVLTIERSLDLGKKDLAGRLDDVLLRQRFWEEDIHLEDGALSDLEANDALASSIIRYYIDEIRHQLQDVIRAISSSSDNINHEKETLSRLYKTNARLCDQIEIFDAIAANESANATGSDRKDTAIGQLRRQLRKEHDTLQSSGEIERQSSSTTTSLRESDAAMASTQNRKSSGKREAALAAAMLLPSLLIPQRTKGAGVSFTTAFDDEMVVQKDRNKSASSASDDTKVAQRVRDRHSVVLEHYKSLIQRIKKESHINTAFKIEFIRAQQCDRILNEDRSLALWSLCDWVVSNEEAFLILLLQSTKSQSFLYGLLEQGERDLDSPYESGTTIRASPRHEASDKEGIVAESASFSEKNPERQLEASVRRLGSWNDTILGLSSPAVQETLHRELRISVSTFDIAEHQYLRSASALLGYPDLEQVAKARSLVGQLQAHPQERFSKYLIPNDNSLLLGKAEISWQGKPPARFDTVCSATYRDENVIVQWFELGNDFIETSYRIHLMQSFSEVLNTSLIPLNLSSLCVLGYFEQASHLFGCVYRLPPDTSSSHWPVTLRELLDGATIDTVPELGERFEISIALAKTIHELHIMGLVHRDLRPENILFWPTTWSGNDRELSRPYLIGFNFGLVPPSVPGSFDEREERTSYPFNQSWYSSTSESPNNASIDLSCLGGVLFEIGLWRRSYPLSTAKRTNFDPRSEDGSISLKGYVGKRYEDVVKVCLYDGFGELLDNHTSEDPLRSYLFYFEKKVVGPIAMCKA